MRPVILNVENLTKKYDDYLAVDHISFAIKEGEIMGLLGQNGAGKSTTIQMLLGLTTADAGKIEYFGKNFFEHREECLSRINFASAYTELQSRLTVYQNLRVFAGLYDVKDAQSRIKELLQLLEIEPYASTLFWKLSSGQKTRVILAKALLNRPKMLLMDEPTASLDPDIINKMIALIKELQAKENLAILYTSHNMEEITRLCDRVAFLAKGKIVALDTPIGLTKKIGFLTLELAFEGDHKKVAAFCRKHNYDHNFVNKSLVEIQVEESAVPKVLFGLKEKDIWITNISIQKPSMEDVFIKISQDHTL